MDQNCRFHFLLFKSRCCSSTFGMLCVSKPFPFNLLFEGKFKSGWFPYFYSCVVCVVISHKPVVIMTSLIPTVEHWVCQKSRKCYLLKLHLEAGRHHISYHVQIECFHIMVPSELLSSLLIFEYHGYSSRSCISSKSVCVFKKKWWE